MQLLGISTHSLSCTSKVHHKEPQQHRILIAGFLDNVLRHPEFLSGKATTSFIERTPELFEFGGRHDQKASKLLNYLANMVSILQWR